MSCLLKRDKGERLGCGPGEYQDVMKHKWFADIDFDKLLKRELDAPYKPEIPEQDLTKFFTTESDLVETLLTKKEKKLIECN